MLPYLCTKLSLLLLYVNEVDGRQRCRGEFRLLGEREPESSGTGVCTDAHKVVFMYEVNTSIAYYVHIHMLRMCMRSILQFLSI